MSILPSPTTAVPSPATPSPARRLPPLARQRLALDALAGQPISALAAQGHVSRPFVYCQLRHAHEALDRAFTPAAADPPELLFWLPVTKPWLRQLVTVYRSEPVKRFILERYQDSVQQMYQIAGRGKNGDLSLVLTSGQ